MKRATLVLWMLVVVSVVTVVFGCAGSADSAAPPESAVASGSTSVQPTNAPTTLTPNTTEAPVPATEPSTTVTNPPYTSWTVYINDDDSYTQGDITYSIALNLTATNPSPDIAGAYSGSATASTSVEGTVQGLPLNASSIVNSTKLEFTLEDPTGGKLAPLTEGGEGLTYSGSGTIVMKASGSGSIGPAGGGFSNTSGQTIKVAVTGSSATLSVDIEGHTYTFEGTISGA